MENKISTVTTQIISSTPPSIYDPSKDPGLVGVLINYPDDFRGQKFFQQGEKRYVSAESAKQFVEAGFASYLPKEEAETPAETKSENSQDNSQNNGATVKKARKPQ